MLLAHRMMFPIDCDRYTQWEAWCWI